MFVLGLALPAFACLLMGAFTSDQDKFFHYAFPPLMTAWNLFLFRRLGVLALTPWVPVPLFVLGLLRTVYLLWQAIAS